MRSSIGPRRHWLAAATCRVLVAAVLAVAACRRDDFVPVGTLRIVLLGDSTTWGSICRLVDPDGPHLESMIAASMAAHHDLPPVQVVNQGRDDETIQRLLESGRYKREIARLARIDYAVIRYGINDSVRRRDFEAQFPRDYHNLIRRLRDDFPDVKIILSTTTPFRTAAKDENVNLVIKDVAAVEQLPLVDVYTRFRSKLMDDPNALSYRRVPVSAIPQAQRELARPYTHGGFVILMDGRLDNLFRTVPGWFDDRHPNFAGYRVIADETAAVLATQIRLHGSEHSVAAGARGA